MGTYIVSVATLSTSSQPQQWCLVWVLSWRVGHQSNHKVAFNLNLSSHIQLVISMFYGKVLEKTIFPWEYHFSKNVKWTNIYTILPAYWKDAASVGNFYCIPHVAQYTPMAAVPRGVVDSLCNFLKRFFPSHFSTVFFSFFSFSWFLLYCLMFTFNFPIFFLIFTMGEVTQPLTLFSKVL